MDRRVALVTGAGGGIGRAAAVRLAADGFSVVATDVNEGALGETIAVIHDSGGSVIGADLDVTDLGAISEVYERARREWSPVQVLVNCAGNLYPTAFRDIAESEWDTVFAVNLKGTFLCCQSFLPGMSEAGWGRIINISSTAGKNVSTVGGAHYTAAKAGVLGLTRHLALEVAADGITVNAICPGLIDTPMISRTISRERMDAYARSFPIERLGSPEEVASIVSFLASDEAAYITGAAIDINGGDLMV